MSRYIECLIKRAGGSFVDLGTARYHFEPATGLPNAPHIAEIDDADAVTLLRIPEAYRPASDSDLPIPALMATTSIPALDEFASLSDGAIADRYTQAFGFSPLKGSKREDMLAAVRTAPARIGKNKPAPKLKAAPVPDPVTGDLPPLVPPVDALAYDAMPDDALLNAYVAIFGADPALDMDRSAIIEALKAVQE